MDMEVDIDVGLLEPKRIRTNVVTAKPVEKKDKVVIDGSGD